MFAFLPCDSGSNLIEVDLSGRLLLDAIGLGIVKHLKYVLRLDSIFVSEIWVDGINEETSIDALARSRMSS